jgi:hypothetical protein
MIDYLRFYVPLKNFSLIWRRHHCRWRAVKFKPMLGARGLWAGRDLYRATPAVTRDLGISSLIWRTAPFSRLLRHTRGCGGTILTRILTGLWSIWQNALGSFGLKWFTKIPILFNIDAIFESLIASFFGPICFLYCEKVICKVDHWLTDYLKFHVPLKNFSLI